MVQERLTEVTHKLGLKGGEEGIHRLRGEDSRHKEIHGKSHGESKPGMFEEQHGG